MPIKDLAPYMLIMQYDAKEQINAGELAQKFGKPTMQIMSLISHAANDGTVYDGLRAKGYADSQIPTWFAREGSAVARVTCWVMSRDYGTIFEHWEEVKEL